MSREFDAYLISRRDRLHGVQPRCAHDDVVDGWVVNDCEIDDLRVFFCGNGQFDIREL